MYKKEELERIAALFQSIEAGKSHAYAAPTYKDSPELKEMAAIILSDNEDSIEALENKTVVLTYLATSYDYMCRAGISVKYHKLLLEAYARLAALRPLSDKELAALKDALYAAVKARNFYEKDPCADLAAAVSGLLPEEAVKKTLSSAAKPPYIKHDPVEKSAPYLAVIDDVEELVATTRQTDVCFEGWRLKAGFLAERGIAWRSPAALNPGVRFD